MYLLLYIQLPLRRENHGCNFIIGYTIIVNYLILMVNNNLFGRNGLPIEG